MLIRFATANFMSFKDTAELSLVPSQVRKHGAHIIKSEGNDFDQLKTAIIYGGNASGKSNLIKAMSYAQDLIINPGAQSTKRDKIHFKLDPECAERPTTFLFEIKTEKGCFEFTFEILNGAVVSERLVKVSRRSETLIFNRDTHNFEHKIRFENSDDEQFFKFTERGTPDTKLFIRECKDRNITKEINNVASIESVLNWFENTLTIIFPNTKYIGIETAIDANESLAESFVHFLKNYDTGIDGLEIKPVKFETLEIPGEIRNKIVETLDPGETTIISSQLDDQTYMIRKSTGTGHLTAFKMVTEHNSADGTSVSFNVNEESDGTRRLIDICPGLFEIFTGEKVLVVDELDRSLHPEVTSSLLKDFLNFTKGKNSQFIVTTHDAMLLDLEIFRKDEIWFTQKNRTGQSQLYSLQEFDNIRFDMDIRKGYLAGRFGGVPIVKQLKFDFEGSNR